MITSVKVSMVIALFFFISQSAFITTAAPGNAGVALYVARHLDVLSFPNSMSVRARPSGHTLMDYGFVGLKLVGSKGEVGVYARGTGWFFSIQVMDDEGDTKILCVKDMSADRSYSATYPIEVRLGSDGLFHGTGRTFFPKKIDECHLEVSD